MMRLLLMAWIGACSFTGAVILAAHHRYQIGRPVSRQAIHRLGQTEPSQERDHHA